MYAKIENKAVVEWPISSLTDLFPNTSFPAPMTDAAMPDGYVMVGVTEPPQPGPGQKVVPGQPVQQGGKWVQSWDIVPMTDQEIQERHEAQANTVRAERNRLLTESDWTQVADAPVDRTAWAGYRQSLRDVTAQAGFPFNIVWPEQPAR